MNNRKRLIVRVYRKYPILYVYGVISIHKTYDELLFPDFMIKCVKDALKKSILPRSIKPISPLKFGRMNVRHDGYNVQFTTFDEIKHYDIEEAKRFYGL